MSKLSINRCSVASIPRISGAMESTTASTAPCTPFPSYRWASPSRRSTTSKAPVDAPEGTAARAMVPSSRATSTSTVGLPRESKISRAPTDSIVDTGVSSAAGMWRCAGGLRRHASHDSVPQQPGLEPPRAGHRLASGAQLTQVGPQLLLGVHSLRFRAQHHGHEVTPDAGRAVEKSLRVIVAAVHTPRHLLCPADRRGGHRDVGKGVGAVGRGGGFGFFDPLPGLLDLLEGAVAGLGTE